MGGGEKGTGYVLDISFAVHVIAVALHWRGLQDTAIVDNIVGTGREGGA